MDYISAFSNLKTNNKYARKSPHKAVLLLTVIEMFEKGLISENEIRYDDLLVETFQKVWNKVLPEETTFYANVHFPFWYLHSEGFWHNVPFRNREDSFKEIWDNKIRPTESKVKELVQYAELDEDLFFLMTMPSGRASLKRTLLESYTSLSEAAIARLSKSEDNTVDNSIAAMNEYQTFLNSVGTTSSILQAAGDDKAQTAFAELSEELQITLNLEYYKFLKSQPLEREYFRELYPTAADLYYHTKYAPYKKSQVDYSRLSILTNFLYDLRITLMSEDGAMALIDAINDSIHALQDSIDMVSVDAVSDTYTQESSSEYQYSKPAGNEPSVEERIAKLHRELEESDKKNDDSTKTKIVNNPDENTVFDENRYN